MRKTLRKRLVLPLALLGVLAIPVQALAHSVETNYLKIDEMLELETVFSSGEPLRSANVKIYAPGKPDQPWLEGTTDENGKFAFEPDKSIPGEWEVFIKERGHADILTVPVTKQGVDVDKISEASRVHMHYFAGPLALFGILVGGGFFAWSKRQNLGRDQE